MITQIAIKQYKVNTFADDTKLTNFERFFTRTKKQVYRGVFTTLSNVYNGTFFENVNCLKLLIISLGI